MTDYKAIFGKKIKFLTSDLSMSTATEGELFYSDTNKKFKVGITVLAWSSGENMNTARNKAGGTLASGSTQGAGLAIGGQAGTTIQAVVEEYDGTNWAESGDIPARRWHYAGGTQTAAFCAGGDEPGATATTHEYNGSTWTAGEDMGTGRYNGGSAGTQTAGIAMAGSPAPSYTRATEEYDGTDWAAGGDMPVAKGYFGGGGTQTAALAMGIGPNSTDSYEYDGSSWASSVSMNRGCSQGSVAGIQTAAISFGGTPPTTATEYYDGSSWTNYPSMATARYALAAASGTATSAMGAGGYAPPASNATEEFSGTVTLKTVTDS